MMSFMPRSAAVTKRWTRLGLFLEHLIGHSDPLRHVRKKLIARNDFDLHAGGLDRRYPIGHARHACGFAGRHKFPDPAWARRLNVEVVLREADARKQSE